MTFPETASEQGEYILATTSLNQKHKEAAQTSLLESFDAGKIYTLQNEHPDLRTKGVQKRGSEHKFTDWLIGTQFYGDQAMSYHYIPINLDIESLTAFINIINLEAFDKTA